MEQMIDEFRDDLDGAQRDEYDRLRRDLKPIATEGVVDLELVLAALDVMSAGQGYNPGFVYRYRAASDVTPEQIVVEATSLLPPLAMACRCSVPRPVFCAKSERSA
jgi:hypothetical protein